MDTLDIELRKHKFIAFVEDHYTPLGVVRSLGEANIPFDVILINSERQYLVSSSKYVKKMVKFPTYEEGLDYLVRVYGNEDHKPFVLTGCDNIANLMDAHYDELKDKFYFYNAGETGRLAWLQNKFNITSLGEEAGLDNPRREVVDTGVLPKSLRYPVITKVLMSIMGAWKGDVYVCNNEAELKKAYTKIQSPKLMVQEYVKKKGEFCMEGFSINKGQDVCMPYIVNYIRLTSTSYGDYMELSPFNNEELKHKILELFKKTKFEGIFEIEFMRGPKEETYFLEINFRASTWNYALTAGGCNMPYLWAKSTLAGRILTEEMNLEKKPFTAIVDIDEFITSVVKYKKVGVLQWLKEWNQCKAHYQYNSNDMAPFWGHLLHRTLGKIQKKLHLK